MDVAQPLFPYQGEWFCRSGGGLVGLERGRGG